MSTPPHVPSPAQPGDDEGIRLSKRVAALVPCSRSEAERYIEGGWVKVDGQVETSPQARVTPAQQVALDSEASLLALAPVTLLWHQVPGAALPGPQDRWSGDRSGLRVAPGLLRHLTPLLPLPPEASGLAVFSQDRRILRKFGEEGWLLEQELIVEVSGQIAEGGLARLAHGLVWRGEPLPPAKVSWQSEQRLRFAFKGIDPALVPWMCGQVGLVVTGLRRIRIGRLPLAPLPAGQWRCLQPHERF